MDSQSIRDLAFQAPRRKVPVDTPFWPGTDGNISIGDMSADELDAISKLSGTPNYGATFICYALVSGETGKRIYGTYNKEGEFMPTDRDWIKEQTTVIMELMPKINAFFGIGKPVKQQVEDAKKN